MPLLFCFLVRAVFTFLISIQYYKIKNLAIHCIQTSWVIYYLKHQYILDLHIQVKN